jgi:4'-phosphopantetheinyl transferase
VGDGQIKLWLGDLAATEVDCPQFWRILDQAEQQHALTIRNGEIHKRYVEVRARLRLLLGDTVNAAPEQLRIGKSEYGKPYLLDYPNLAFNLSHSGNKLAIAIAYDCAIGIDIECCKPRLSLTALAEKCFSEEELSYWRQLRETERTYAFYQFWTRKEAFVKATGRGIALGLNRCAVNPLNLTEFLRIPDGYGERHEWRIQDIDLGEAMCGALVAR